MLRLESVMQSRARSLALRYVLTSREEAVLTTLTSHLSTPMSRIFHSGPCEGYGFRWLSSQGPATEGDPHHQINTQHIYQQENVNIITKVI